jgi:hypothetical protein
MIAFEVLHNGKRICVAGAEDLAVLSTTVTAVGKLGTKTVPVRPDDLKGEIFYSVGGLTGRKDPKKDVHVRWKKISHLKVGDIVQVKVLETKKVDKARYRFKAKRTKRAGRAGAKPNVR